MSVKFAHYLQTINIYFFAYLQKGCSPLYVASQEGHTDVVDILLRKGADVNQTTTNEVCATINLCVYRVLCFTKICIIRNYYTYCKSLQFVCVFILCQTINYSHSNLREDL